MTYESPSVGSLVGGNIGCYWAACGRWMLQKLLECESHRASPPTDLDFCTRNHIVHLINSERSIKGQGKHAVSVAHSNYDDPRSQSLANLLPNIIKIFGLTGGLQSRQASDMSQGLPR